MKKGTMVIIIIIALLILANLTLFIVDETKQAIVLQFGKPIRVITEPGLNFKLPFIQNVVFFEDRLLVYDGFSNYQGNVKKSSKGKICSRCF